jgi:hypothetical protein
VNVIVSPTKHTFLSTSMKSRYIAHTLREDTRRVKAQPRLAIRLINAHCHSENGRRLCCKHPECESSSNASLESHYESEIVCIESESETRDALGSR